MAPEVISSFQQIDESKAMKDLNSRIQQLTKLILTSQTVDENKGDDSRPTSPSKVDFDMSPYQVSMYAPPTSSLTEVQLQQELLTARRQMDSQANQILSLEAALLARPEVAPDAPETDKEKIIADQQKKIRELEIAISGYENNLGEPLRQVREDVEREWEDRFAAEVKRREEKEAWANELVKQLEKEKKVRIKLEEEKRALAAFVSKFDALGLGGGSVLPSSSTSLPSSVPTPTPFGKAKSYLSRLGSGRLGVVAEETDSPIRIDLKNQPSLLDQMPEEEWSLMEDISFEMEIWKGKPVNGRRAESSLKEVLGRKENIPM